VKEITRNGAKFLNGKEIEFDSIILATGYKSNVPDWLKVLLSIYYLSYSLSCYIYVNVYMYM